MYESQMSLEQCFRPVQSAYNGGGTEDTGRPSNEENGEVDNNTGQADN